MKKDTWCIRGGFKGGPTGPGPPPPIPPPTVLYACAMTLAVMAKKQQKRLTAWLSVDEEPAKRTRQDDNRAVEDAPLVAGGGDEASVSPALTSDSNTCSRFDPSSLTLPNSDGPGNSSTRLTLCSKPYDIGIVGGFSRELTREEKYGVINDIYKPPPNYVFPQHAEGQGSHKRSFQSKWLHEYTWLAYSMEKDGGYCVPCVFFCKNPEGLGKLVNQPLNRLKDAVSALRQHGKKPYHMHAVSDMVMFMQVMRNERQPISHQLVSSLAQTVQNNRQFLKSIIHTIIFCGKQNVSLRGHRDDAQHLQQPGNHGNFHALLHFRTESGDKTLQTYLEKAPQNARYT